MDQHTTENPQQQNQNQDQPLPEHFWAALITIHNRYYGSVLDAWANNRSNQEIKRIYEAFCTMDSWIDAARSRGWWG